MSPAVTEDRFWGFVLIAFGVAALTFQPFDKINAVLRGESDHVLTFICFGLAAVVILIGIKGSPGLKALAVFWVITP